MTDKVVAKLSTVELVAWDMYVAAAVQAALSCWFRWKMGVPIDRKQIVSESCMLADMLILERRTR